MFKRKLPNLLLYICFLASTIDAFWHGVTLLYWVTAALTAVLLVLDILEVIRNGRKV